jgi:MazG family protein
MTDYLTKLREIIRYLRNSPDGCVWTQAQTHKSLTPYLIEESYETAASIDEDKTGGELRDELGDLLLQIVFHAQIAEERKAFTLDDVAEAIVKKLERRYPTILGNEPNTLKTPEEIMRRWEEVKAEERKAKGIKIEEASLLDEISHGLPSLIRAAKMKGRVAKEGFEWPHVGLQLDKIEEEIAELRAEVEAPNPDNEKIAHELGDLMFMLVDCARWHGIDAEDAMRTTNNRFEKRFRYVERGIRNMGKNFKTASREERIALWDEAKKQEKAGKLK